MTAPATALDDYAVFCEGVRRLCQVDLSQYKRNQMERRVRSFAERRGAGALPAYLQTLERDPLELERFLDRMTINVSQLWRNPSQWATLASSVMPDLAPRAGAPIRAWSAGSSYGAEAYTLAAVGQHAMPGVAWEIRGTDIDRRMVARAREGVFSETDARDAPPEQLRRSFERVPEGWRAGATLRAVTSFEVGDLLRMSLRPQSYDLILCRNTVIYFTEDVRDALHQRLAQALRPGGCLMIGSTERVTDPGAIGLTPTHPFTYRKR